MSVLKTMRTIPSWAFAVLATVALALAMAALAGVMPASGGAAQTSGEHRVFVPGVASDGPLPTPTPTPPAVVDHGNVVSMRIESIGVTGNEPVEVRDTHIVAGQEQFQDPANPQAIAYYPRFSSPDNGGVNSMFAAHVNYFTGVATPFARIQQLQPGADIFLTFEDGTTLRYTVKTNETVPLSSLSGGAMNAVVWPILAADRERITLISCGGVFVPNPSGVGGGYLSRIIVTAERVLPQ